MRFILFLLIFSFQIPAQAQVKGKKLKSTAISYYEKNKFSEAVNLFEKYRLFEPGDESVFAKLGISYFKTTEVAKAIKYLKIVVANSKSPDPLQLFFLARSLHLDGQFKEAARYFKLFLKEGDKGDPRRGMVKDMLQRCGKGLQMSGWDENAIVENLGPVINSKYDESAPILSPNYSNKLYYSSSREGAVGGLRDADGFEDPIYGEYKMDMYSTYERGGQWTVPEVLGGLINSSSNDLILDFLHDGKVLFFLKSSDLVSGKILVDTFNQDQTRLFPETFNGPVDGSQGDVSLQFYNDSILIFASRMAGGFGGLDLYISRKRENRWTVGKNLGPEINSAYDETTPFLCKDGRTLYFSSNNLNSMGGFDIFQAKYIDQEEKWTAPENLGKPINSPGHDQYFRMAPDGLKSYFASRRSGGFGESDIYVAYFKKERQEQLLSSRPMTFDLVPQFRRSQRDAGELSVVDPIFTAEHTTHPNPVAASNQAIQTYRFRPLYINQNDQVLGPGNTQELEKIGEFLISNPQAKVLLRGHGDGSSPDKYKLYFSIKRAEKASEYLLAKGVNDSQLLLQGFGDQFPILKPKSESGPKINSAKVNRRVDYKFLGLENSPIIIEMEKQKVRSNLLDERGVAFLESQEGLYFRIQVAAVGQNFEIPAALNNKGWTVEKTPKSTLYRYLMGNEKSYFGAKDLKNLALRQGLAGAYIVPYFKGKKLKRAEIILLSEQFQELRSYLSEHPQ